MDPNCCMMGSLVLFPQIGHPVPYKTEAHMGLGQLTGSAPGLPCSRVIL